LQLTAASASKEGIDLCAGLHGATFVIVPPAGDSAAAETQVVRRPRAINPIMISKCWPQFLVAASWLAAMFFLFRVSAFRADRPDYTAYFGLPYSSNRKYLGSDNFRPAGRKYLYMFWVASCLFGVSGALAVFLCT
jgi:hypothetical protein